METEWVRQGNTCGVRPVSHLRVKRKCACIVLVVRRLRKSTLPIEGQYREVETRARSVWLREIFPIGGPTRSQVHGCWISIPVVPISCMPIGASVANSASYGTVRASFDQCCGITVTLEVFVRFFPVLRGDFTPTTSSRDLRRPASPVSTNRMCLTVPVFFFLSRFQIKHPHETTYCNRAVHVHARASNKSVTLSRCSVPSGAFRSRRMDLLLRGGATLFSNDADAVCTIAPQLYFHKICLYFTAETGR